MLVYEIIVHKVGDKYTNEHYIRNEKNGALQYIDCNSKFMKLSKGQYSAVEIYHGEDYQKIESPFQDQDGNFIHLYGRFVKSRYARISEYEARFNARNIK